MSNITSVDGSRISSSFLLPLCPPHTPASSCPICGGSNAGPRRESVSESSDRSALLSRPSSHILALSSDGYQISSHPVSITFSPHRHIASPSRSRTEARSTRIPSPAPHLSSLFTCFSCCKKKRKEVIIDRCSIPPRTTLGGISAWPPRVFCGRRMNE